MSTEVENCTSERHKTIKKNDSPRYECNEHPTMEDRISKYMIFG